MILRRDVNRPLTHDEVDDNFVELKNETISNKEDLIQASSKTLAEYPTLADAIADDIPDGVVFLVNDDDDAGYWRRDSSDPEGAEFLRRHITEENVKFLAGGNVLEGLELQPFAYSPGVVIEASNFSSFVVPVSEGDELILSRENTINNNRFAYFFTETPPAHLVPILGDVTRDDNAMTFDIKVPADANYLVVYLSNEGETDFPGVSLLSNNFFAERSKLEEVTKDIEAVKDTYKVKNELEGLTLQPFTYQASNNIVVQGSSYSSFIVPVSDTEEYLLVRENILTNAFAYFFTVLPPANLVPLLGSFVRDDSAMSFNIDVPEGANYLVIYLNNGQGVVDTSGISLVRTNLLDEIPKLNKDVYSIRKEVEILTALGRENIFSQDMIVPVAFTSGQALAFWQENAGYTSLHIPASPGDRVTVVKPYVDYTNRFQFATTRDAVASPGNQVPITAGDVYGEEILTVVIPEQAEHLYIYLNTGGVVDVSEMKVFKQEKDQSWGRNFPFIAGDLTSFYKSPETEDVSSSGVFVLENSVIEDIYGEWDALMADFPDVISKNLLGYGADENGENTELPIYEYVVKGLVDERPLHPMGQNKRLDSNPLVLLMGGVHGEEKSVVWSTLQFFSQLLHNWDSHDGLAALRSSVDFKIIPICNPWGYNNNIREMANGDNLNRVFDQTYDPLADPEARAIQSWMLDNVDAQIFIDFHSAERAHNILTYVLSESRDVERVWNSFIRNFSLRYKKEFGLNDSDNNIEGFFGNLDAGLTIRYAYRQAGIPYAATIEIVEDFPSGQKYTPIIIRSGVDLLANYLLASFDYFNKRK